MDKNKKGKRRLQKIKSFFKSFIKKDSFVYKVLRKLYHLLSTIKYKIMHSKEVKEQNSKYNKRAEEAIEKIKQYQEKDYIVFYNPTWLGVAASTMGLFENIVPLEHVYGKKQIQAIGQTIVDYSIKSVIFSQICDGWTTIIEEIKKKNPEIQTKVIWHGNCYEYFSDFTWNLNKEVMQLYKQGKINCFAFVRSTMYEFYKKVGFQSFYLQNNVHKENAGKMANHQNKKTKIGIYNADSRELKNIYTALSAMKLVPNSIADVVPINAGAKQFTEILNLETTSIDDYIPNEELMKRIQQNDINIYPTFTENAPMFPLESFEMGVPCLLGNNNDYFIGTKLGKYVILQKEDDAEYIKDKIIEVLKNKEEIMNLYQAWKKEFDKKCEKLVKEFVKL